MESDFARGESVNKAEIAQMRDKIEKQKQGIKDDMQEFLLSTTDGIDDGQSGAVQPIKDCPHCKPDNIIPLRDLIAKGIK